MYITPYFYKINCIVGGDVDTTIGIMFAENFGQAAANLEETYQSLDEILLLKPASCADKHCYIEIPEEYMEGIENANW